MHEKSSLKPSSFLIPLTLLCLAVAGTNGCSSGAAGSKGNGDQDASLSPSEQPDSGRDAQVEDPDVDGDGKLNEEDNCPRIVNADQADRDGDRHGDACDNCPSVANSAQEDQNKDGIGDACIGSELFGSADEDGDGIANAQDLCVRVASPNNSDSDRDGVGDACDNCPVTANTNQADEDKDGEGDACEGLMSVTVDADGDGVSDAIDNCPGLTNDQADADGDGKGDACDNCPGVANYSQFDTDKDGKGDACEQVFANPNADDDGDTVKNGVDNCPQTANKQQGDADGDKRGDACDNCPNVANANQDPAACMNMGAGDEDGDGKPNAADNCVAVSNPLQTDKDKDGRGDACDNCVEVANFSQTDANMNSVGDACEGSALDRDGDGKADIVDNCIKVSNSDQADDDKDGVGNACDNCRSVANSGQQDSDGDKIGDHCDPDLSLEGDEICAGANTQANSIKPNLYFLLDSSGSMKETDGTSPARTRVQRLVAALDTMAGTNAAPGTIIRNFNQGVGEFPTAGGSCTEGDLPEELLAMGANSADGFKRSYASLAPEGGTPTDLALKRVRGQGLYNLPRDTEPARPKAVVLITDGSPNDCKDIEPDRVERTIEQARLLAAANVPVYVIGFAGVNTEVMQALAYAGNPATQAGAQTCISKYPSRNAPTNPACVCDPDYSDYAPKNCTNYSALNGTWYQVSDTQSIVNAVNSIVTRTVGCTLRLNATGANPSDTGILTVELVRSSPASRTKINADATNGYTLSGNAVTLHGTSCTNLQNAVAADGNARVEVKAGCACVPASAENCTTDVDDNCNGRVNEGCSTPSTCGVDAAATDCAPTSCGLEICNGKDDDCDMQVDEGCPASMCTSPTLETCDGKDNDCDGSIDEDCPACAQNSEVCDGKDNDCDQMIDEGCEALPCTPFAEICNSKDDDCDGVADDMCVNCQQPSSEVCDRSDNDCDGIVDEGCPPAVE